MRASVLAGLCVGASLAASLRADDAVPRVLLDRELNSREVMLTGIDDGWVTWLDAARRPRRAPTTDLVAIIAPDEGVMPERVRDQIARSLNFPVIETTDGQRLTARVRPDSERSPEHVELVLVGGSSLRVRVEQIDSLSMPRAQTDAPPEPDDALDDVVVLDNGDTLRGFVSGLGSSVTIEVEGEERTVSLEQIARIDLANPPAPTPGTRALLDDGSVLACESISTEGGIVTLALSLGAGESGVPDSESAAPTQLRLPLSRIAGVRFDHGGEGAGVRALSAEAPASFAPSGSRRHSAAPETIAGGVGVLGDARIALPGPMRVRWAIPDEASRVAGVLTLGDRPGPWADCDVIVRLVDADGAATELARHRLRAAEPEAPFNIDLGWGGDGRSIEFVVEEGAFGPVQDRVYLDRVLLLVE